jgi:hypothetical protein
MFGEIWHNKRDLLIIFICRHILSEFEKLEHNRVSEKNASLKEQTFGFPSSK